MPDGLLFLIGVVGLALLIIGVICAAWSETKAGR